MKLAIPLALLVSALAITEACAQQSLGPLQYPSLLQIVKSIEVKADSRQLQNRWVVLDLRRYDSDYGFYVDSHDNITFRCMSSEKNFDGGKVITKIIDIDYHLEGSTITLDYCDVHK